MSTQEPSDDAVDAQCLQVATWLCERYGWRLLEAEQLARLVGERLTGAVQLELRRCAIAEYCCVMHAAASGAEGPVRQNLAYEELARFLAGALRQRYPGITADQRDDVLQSALERTFRGFASCREPRAFFAFAVYRLLDAVREAQRHWPEGAESLERSVAAAGAPLEPAEQPEPAAGLLAAERRVGIERFLQLYLQAHPRAGQQVEVQRLSLIGDLEDGAIAQELGITVDSVYVARSRFASTVRREPQWRKLAEDLGILPDEL